MSIFREGKQFWSHKFYYDMGEFGSVKKFGQKSNFIGIIQNYILLQICIQIFKTRSYIPVENCKVKKGKKNMG